MISAVVLGSIPTALMYLGLKDILEKAFQAPQWAGAGLLASRYSWASWAPSSRRERCRCAGRRYSAAANPPWTKRPRIRPMVDGATPKAAVMAALGYFQSIQDASGAFGFLADTEPDAQSTAFVIQALVAVREEIDAGGPWTPGGVTPLEALLTFQNPETGAFQFAGEDSAFATYQVVPGLVLAPFPGLKPILLPGTATPVASPTMAVESVETPEPVASPDELPNTGTRVGSGGSLWLLTALMAGGLAAIGTGAFVGDSGSARRRRIARHERRC